MSRTPRDDSRTETNEGLLERLEHFVGDLRPAAWGHVPLADVHPDGVEPHYRHRYGGWSAWVMALPLDAAIIAALPETLTEYAGEYRELNVRLDEMADRLAGFARSLIVQAEPIPASGFFNSGTLHGGVSHKHVGLAAGLGILGDSALLLLPRLGPRARLVTVLLDVAVPGTAPQSGPCLQCGRCADACPVGAILAPRDGHAVVDREACHTKLGKNQARYGFKVCGLCIQACPHG